MKYIDVEKLIAEVERLCAEHTSRWETDEVAIVLDKLEDFIISLQQEQTDFPTTDEQVKEFLATHPKIEVPEKYKNPDFLFKKQEQPKEDWREKRKEECPFRRNLDNNLYGCERYTDVVFACDGNCSWVVDYPKLKESEDERIGNVIYCIVRDNKEVKRILEGNGVSVDNALAYLEKQKINTEGDFGRGYDCGYKACLNSHGAEFFEKQKEQKPSINIDQLKSTDEKRAYPQ